MEKKVYYALFEGDINGRYRKAGDPVGELTAREAKYPLMHGLISAEKPEPKGKKEAERAEPDPVNLDRKTR
ncbi:hypothetical protein [Rhizobium sp. SSA_523]|uniref:hypothetical protein n=1 Tax=Rhizobium sp. SSA_523 TaxID=2952477 RepID=UPI002091DF20|nr:hypothetical protein [Rhizobium sp. SSA_523]MCO5730082.1 hypothetical protein [Rhizobium sp. SSA_523]WKC25147.1 hypothetical protein QTJ18_14260 [Rhizobium sp. SSA_523]